MVAQLVAETVAAAWLVGGHASARSTPAVSAASAVAVSLGRQAASKPPVAAAEPELIAARTPPEATGASCPQGPQPAPPAPPAPNLVAQSAAGSVPPGQRWALVVGVSHYDAPTHPTIGGARDAALVRAVLLQAGWLPDHVRVLTDGAATAGAVCAGMSWLVAHSGPTSFTFLHYSGHVQERGGHEYPWPVDNSLLRDAAVAQLLGQVRGHAWFDFAGCESAGFDEGLSSPLRLVSSSSRQDEKSYELPSWGESVWTGFVFDQGLRQGRADADGDGVVTVGEALAYGAARAPALTAGQRPYGPQHPTTAGGGRLGWSLAAPPG